MTPGRSTVTRRGIARSLIAVVVVASVLVVIEPASHASLNRVGAAAATPHNNVAAIYNLFGAQPDDSATLATVGQDLADEGYKVQRYSDPTEGAGSRGTATLANFVAMAKQASVIVINGHGYDPTAGVQDCIGGKGFVGYGEPVLPTPNPNAQSCAGITEPILQVEWYPTMAAGEQAKTKYVAQGYQKGWLAGPFEAATNIAPRKGDDVKVDENGFPAPQLGGERPALFLTASGIAHFFGNQKLDLVDVLSCQSIGLAPSFNARTYFAHARTGCTGKESLDEPKLFERMTGHSGIEARPSTKAFEMGGFTDQYFQMAKDSEPVVLSPAVASVAPSDGGGVDGVTTPVSITFDAQMAKAAANGVVTASGCDATVANPQWKGDDGFTFDLKLPKIQTGKTVTLTVHQDKAKSAGAYAHALDGNQDPSDSGVAPNRDDYVWKLSCAPSQKFKMVYTGTYAFQFNQTFPQLVPTNETDSYTWTQTQIVTVTAATNPNTSEYESVTTLDASGSSVLDYSGTHLTCTIQTPGDYQWVTKRLGQKYKSSTPIGFSLSIESPPPPGSPGATGTAGNGPPSGCTNEGDFTATLGIPEPITVADQKTLDDAQRQTFLDAETESLSFTADQMPQTKHYDIDADKSTTEDGVVSTGSMKLHGTVTISKVS